MSLLSSKLLQQLLTHKDAIDLITKRQNISIFFCDLCNFTDLTDRLESEQTIIILNEFLTKMTASIEQHEATVIQIISDAIMAFFGAPEEMNNTQQALKAVQLGVAMQQKIKSLSEKWLT